MNWIFCICAWVPELISRYGKFYLYLLFLLLGLSTLSDFARANTCDTVVAANDPPTCISDWKEVFSSGSYCTNKFTDNIYWQVVVEHPMGVGCSNEAVNEGPYTKRYCKVENGDDPLTEDVDETQLLVVYADPAPLSCPAGYSLSSGYCYLVGECPGNEVAPETCEDGYPVEAGEDIGYGVTCDRPAVIQCSDGAFVREDTGICLTLCDDYSSCLEYSETQLNCPDDSIFDFEYLDPENFSFSCSQIETGSPDNPSNGGNADGNPYNDPNTPAEGEGSTPTSADIDPQSLANYIDGALQDNFDNVERATRDSIDQSKTNTESLIGSIEELEHSNAQGLGSLENAVREGIISNEGALAGVESAVNTLASEVANLDSNGSGPCNPTSTNYHQCLDNPMGTLPSHSKGDASTIAEANNNFKTRIDNAPIVQAFSGMANLLDLDSSACPEFSIDFPPPIDETVSTEIHCELMETVSPILSSVMIVIYIWIAFRIFASA